jgi:cytochrome c peroxidase
MRRYRYAAALNTPPNFHAGRLSTLEDKVQFFTPILTDIDSLPKQLTRG